MISRFQYIQSFIWKRWSVINVISKVHETQEIPSIYIDNYFVDNEISCIYIILRLMLTHNTPILINDPGASGLGRFEGSFL